MGNEIKYDGYLNIGDVVLPCYVLSNGTRVLSGRKMQETLHIVDDNIIGTKCLNFLRVTNLSYSYSVIKNRHILSL